MKGLSGVASNWVLIDKRPQLSRRPRGFQSTINVSIYSFVHPITVLQVLVESKIEKEIGIGERIFPLDIAGKFGGNPAPLCYSSSSQCVAFYNKLNDTKCTK